MFEFTGFSFTLGWDGGFTAVVVLGVVVVVVDDVVDDVFDDVVVVVDELLFVVESFDFFIPPLKNKN